MQGERLVAAPDPSLGELGVARAEPLTLADWLDATGFSEWHAAFRAEGFDGDDWAAVFTVFSPADVASFCDKYGAPAELASELGFFREAGVAHSIFNAPRHCLTRDDFAAWRAAYFAP